MASMEGEPGEPKAKYVHTVESGYRGQPTVLNNVETWANVPQIIGRGAEWFASIGSGDVSASPWGGSSGTKVFSLVGNVNNTGLVEVPMGITLREIVFDIGGGIPAGRTFKAVQTGGPSGGCLPEAELDLPVDFDSLTEAGSMMGSGGLIVMDDRTCMVDVAKYFVDFLMDESCGKCTPCREGLASLHEILGRICDGEGRGGATSSCSRTSARRCWRRLALRAGADGGQPGAVDAALLPRRVRGPHRAEPMPRRGVQGAGDLHHRRRGLHRLHALPQALPHRCITGERKKPHVIDQETCIQCGTCLDACPDDAVVEWSRRRS